MRTIETTATITPDGKLTLEATVDIAPGEHGVVVVIDERVSDNGKRPPLKLSAYPVELLSESHTFRHQD